MYCTNTMKIEMNNNIKAIKAMDIIKSLIMENKDAYNKNYRKDASQMLLDALAIDNNCIIISDELFGEFFPEDSKMFTDIVNALANQLKSEFEAKICNTSDYSEMWIKAFCDGKELELETNYFPCGFSEVSICPECDEELKLYEEIEIAPNKYAIHIFDEFVSGTYTCPNCGETIDISEELPVITKTIRNI